MLLFWASTVQAQDMRYSYQRETVSQEKPIDSVAAGDGLGVYLYSNRYYKSISGLHLIGTIEAETFNGIGLSVFGPLQRNVNGFSLGISALTGQVNGMTVGVGNCTERCNGVLVAGLLLTANRVNGIAFTTVLSTVERLNGWSISAFHKIDTVNGLGISAFANFPHLRGVALSGLLTICDTISGAAISTVNVSSRNLGLNLGIVNAVEVSRYENPSPADTTRDSTGKLLIRAPKLRELTDSVVLKTREGQNLGVMVGLVNNATRNRGLQFGLVNSSIINNGLQVGLYNRSKRGWFPLIKWW